MSADTPQKELDDLRFAIDAHAIMAATDLQGKITFVNGRFCAISKYPRDQLVGQDHRIVNSGHHSKEFMGNLWTTIGQGRVWRGEIRNRARDGTFYWVDTTLVPFLDDRGKPIHYVSIGTDITARKAAEDAQRTAEARYRALFQYAPDGIIIADASSVYLDANASMCRMLGYTPGELIGLNATDIVDPSEVSHIEPALDAIKSKSDYRREWRFRRKDGSTLEADVMATVAPEGQLMAIVRDNTSRKQAARAIQQLNSELEHRVAERTAELEFANKELESFSYSVSHDLRAPLRAVDGFARAVLEEHGPQLPVDARRQLAVIRAGAQRMGDLIDDLLAFSRLGRRALRKRTVKTGPLVAEILEELKGQCEGRRIEITTGELPPCEADQALLKQVWVNLISNAIKYTGKRELARVEIGYQERNGEQAYYVRDNGTGFDMRRAGKLFGVFQRLHRQAEYEGTGVGLAIVKRIVHRHGGRVWADAAMDRGATFYFTLNSDPVP